MQRTTPRSTTAAARPRPARGRVKWPRSTARCPSDGGHLVHHHGGVATQPVARVGADARTLSRGRLHGCISGTTSTPTTRHSCRTRVLQAMLHHDLRADSRAGRATTACGPTACCPGPRTSVAAEVQVVPPPTSRPACAESGAGAGLVSRLAFDPTADRGTEIVESLGAQATISSTSTWGVRVAISGSSSAAGPRRSPPAPRRRSGPG